MNKSLTKQSDAKPMEMAEQLMKLEKLKKDVDARLSDLKRELLATMQDLDVLTLKTGSYTLSRKTWSRVSVTDDKEAEKALAKMGVPVETKMVINMDLMKVPIRNLVVNEGKEIDGIKRQETEYVTVRFKED